MFQAVQKPYVQRPRGRRAGVLGGSEGRERDEMRRGQVGGPGPRGFGFAR